MNSVKKICAILLSIFILVGMFPFFVFGTEPEESVQWDLQQLKLDDDLTMHFFVRIDTAYVDEAVVDITVGEKAYGTNSIREMPTNSDGSYEITVNMAAAQMTENITLSVRVGNDELSRKTYTIADYAAGLLEGNFGNDTKDIAKALLHYGAMAQQYFDYRIDDLANA